jgi:hypothetical protein
VSGSVVSGALALNIAGNQLENQLEKHKQPDTDDEVHFNFGCCCLQCRHG